MKQRNPLERGLLIACLTLVVLAMAGVATAQTTSIKIAVVDLERVVALSESGKALQSKLEAFQQGVKAEADAMKASMDELRGRITQGVNTLSEEKLSDMQKEFEDKTISLRRLGDDKQREGQKIQAEGLRAIEGVLEPIFKKIQEEQGYDLILNYVPGVVVMANERVDITESVVARMNGTQGAGQ
jgi:Skp family chaperone for outer membrane proteins